MTSSIHGKWWCIALLFFMLLLTAKVEAQVITYSNGDTLSNVSNGVFTTPSNATIFSIDTSGNVLDMAGDTVASVDAQGNYRDINDALIGTFTGGTFTAGNGDVLGSIDSSGEVLDAEGKLCGNAGSIDQLHIAYFFFCHPLISGL